MSINGVSFGGKTQQQVQDYFDQKNQSIKDVNFIFTSDEGVATASAGQIDYGYNSSLLAFQAFSLGRAQGIFSDISLILYLF